MDSQYKIKESELNLMFDPVAKIVWENMVTTGEAILIPDTEA